VAETHVLDGQVAEFLTKAIAQRFVRFDLQLVFHTVYIQFYLVMTCGGSIRHRGAAGSRRDTDGIGKYSPLKPRPQSSQRL